MTFAPLWPRSAPPDDRVAEVFLVCFSTGPLRDDVPFSAERFGVPNAQALELADTRTHQCHDNPEWFENWRSGAAGQVAASALGDELALLMQADTCQTISFSVKSPRDFGYLQAAWAIARWMVERGANVVLDAHAGKFLDAKTVTATPPESPLDIGRELLIVFETDAALPSGDHILHTRGMRKFARPDLVAQIGPEDVELVAALLCELAATIANGPMPEGPRHGVDLSGSVTLYLMPDPELAKTLGLNNDALLLAADDEPSLHGLAHQLH